VTPRTAYADRGRAKRDPRLYPPRNAGAADRARAEGVPLVVSFVGDTPYRFPTVFCDPGRRYDWSFLGPRILDPEFKPEEYRGGPHLQVIVAVMLGMDVAAALAEILARCDCSVAYPALAILDRRELAFIVHRPGGGAQLWPVRSGTELWQQYFEHVSPTS